MLFSVIAAASKIEEKIDPKEFEKYSLLASKYSMLKDPLVRECPHCQCQFRRGDNIFQQVMDRKVGCQNSQCVGTQSVKSVGGNQYTFSSGETKYMCWECCGPWVEDNGCGNKECDYFGNGQGSDYKLLQECPTKLVTYNQCSKDCGQTPTLRVCPECKIKIEHGDACKHMTCACKYEFCFICLADWKKGGCNNSTVCKPAARQTI